MYLFSRIRITSAKYKNTIKFLSSEINIPSNELKFNYSRSSGPGGQNVNKLNSKAEIRYRYSISTAIDEDVKGRIKELFSNSINNKEELIIQSEVFRYQYQNKELCIEKLKKMLSEAAKIPNERILYTDISDKEKQNRKEYKRKRSEIKANRRKYEDN